ncbi:hypothetical protein V865_004255 [Kwoniella europaea PYCC6329]|uniref:Uncharacterized protein n=1 Tax=Kwoniella europaea PYCC6329 TaxID=1423913 RepID=A0AAX4KIH0_9TREE
MVKRERPCSPVSSDGSSSTLTPYDSISIKDEKPLVNGKKVRGSPKKDNGGKGGTKVPWSIEEDEALIVILDQVIKTHLWPAIKSSGNTQLIQRGSYGAQYHAKLLIKIEGDELMIDGSAYVRFELECS